MIEYTSMAPVWFTDVLGSAAMIIISFLCVRYAILLRRTEPGNVIWTYLLVLSVALAAFAVSRGVGQLSMRVLVLLGERHIGAVLRPYIGGINTLVFVVVASITVLFFLVHRINTRILKDKKALEDASQVVMRLNDELRDAHRGMARRVEERTIELERVNEKLHIEIAERRKAEAKYRSIFENAVEGIFQTTLEGRYIDANPSMAKIFRYDSAPELIDDITDIGKQVYVDSDRREEFVRLMREGRIVQGFEAQMFRRDGTKMWVSIDARPVYGENGELLYCEGILQDITKRKRAEEALRDSEERYRSLVENIDIGVTLRDSDHTVIMTNAAAAGIVGRESGALLGKSCFQDLALGRKLGPDCPVSSSAAVGKRAELDIETVRDDGSRMNVRMRAIPIYGNNSTVRHYIEITEDVTERARLEEQLRHASKMEAIGQLAGGVAHDFNNILTAILGYTNLVLQEVPQDRPYRHKIERVLQGARRAAGLTGQLLAFSRKQVLDVRHVDVNELIADLGDMLRRLIGENIELRTVLSPSLAKVVADPGQIEQTLMNMVINARDAMPKGGTLTIEASDVFLDEDYARTHPEVRPGEYVMIAVSDTGEGMSPEVVSRIFEPFYTTKQKGKGTGLGLSMVYGILKQHSGHVSVYSEPGRGSTFRLYWPAAPESEPHVEEPAPSSAGHYGTETILVVEDEEAVGELTSEILTMLGYTVLYARHPDEALALAEQHEGPIHLLLTDVVLPRMDGTSLFQLISRKRPETRGLYVSGYTEDHIVHHGVLKPGLNFLQKPFSGDALAGKVRAVLDSPSS